MYKAIKFNDSEIQILNENVPYQIAFNPNTTVNTANKHAPETNVIISSSPSNIILSNGNSATLYLEEL